MKSFTRGISQIVFPRVCVCCGSEQTRYEHQICSFCLENSFEYANPEHRPVSSDTLLPEGIVIQHALWRFDKGGRLQDLLHQLKYGRLINIGLDLGRKLGGSAHKMTSLKQQMEQTVPLIVPVPLHYLKFRYRGFNQAFKIAQGFQRVWKQIAICDFGAVVRTRNTRTQTGFSLDKRLKNLRGAFEVKDKEIIKERFVIIIDDVFTTGATTFELAGALRKAGSGHVAILTIAQA